MWQADDQQGPSKYCMEQSRQATGYVVVRTRSATDDQVQSVQTEEWSGYRQRSQTLKQADEQVASKIQRHAKVREGSV